MSLVETPYVGSIASNVAVTVFTAAAATRVVIKSGIIRNADTVTQAITIQNGGVTLAVFTLAQGEQLLQDEPIVVQAGSTFTVQLASTPVIPWTYGFFTGVVA